ncbi:MAG TPA: hypothetical protein VIK74_07495 [Parasegetibacter sp.]
MNPDLPQKKNYRLKKILVISIGILMLLLAGVHFWIREYAEDVLSGIVHARSGGKLKLEVSKVKYNYRTHHLLLKNAEFSNTDTTGEKNYYRFSIPELNLSLHSIWRLLIKKELLIDTIELDGPEVAIRNGSDISREKVSLSSAMGEVYNAVEQALNTLRIKSLKIQNAGFSLINIPERPADTLRITDISLYLDNLNISQDEDPEKLLFSENVRFTTRNQHLKLPDGLHTISFKSFHIDLKEQMVFLDSASISTPNDDSTQVDMNIFFDTLRITNLGFRELYTEKLIKADSLHCIRPTIQLSLAELPDTLKQKRDINEVIKRLATDMDIGYIEIRNASTHVISERVKGTTSFSSQGDNIEIKKLVLNSESPDPVSVDYFKLAVHNYETYTPDSAYVIRFDSVQFINNSLGLYNFYIATTPGNPSLPNRVHIIPHFELKNISWYDLVFAKKIVADQAILHDPVIHYTPPRTRKTKESSLYNSFDAINDIMFLDSIKMRNGSVNIAIPEKLSLIIRGINGDVDSKKLLEAGNHQEIEASFNNFDFAETRITTPALTAIFNNGRFNGETESFIAEKLTVINSLKTISIFAEDVFTQQLQLDSLHQLSAQHLKWKNATISYKFNQQEEKKKNKIESITVHHLEGNNTLFDIQGEKVALSGFLHNLKADKMIQDQDETLSFRSLSATGEHLFLKSGYHIKAEKFKLAHLAPSELENVTVTDPEDSSSLHISAPQITYQTDINKLLKKNIWLNDINVSSPVIKVKSTVVRKKDSLKPQKGFPLISIGNLAIQNPVLDLKLPAFHMYSPGKDDSTRSMVTGKIFISGVNTTENTLTVNSVVANGNDLRLFTNERAGKFVSLDGSGMHMSNVRLSKIDEVWEAGAVVERFGANRIQLQHADSEILMDGWIGPIRFSSETELDFYSILKDNPDLKFTSAKGRYTTSNTSVQWNNFNFHQDQHQATIDALDIRPVETWEEWAKRSQSQSDYITFHSEKLWLKGFDPVQYLEDSTLRLTQLVINKPYITSYRDKRLPFPHGSIKKLPVDLIKSVPFNLEIGRIDLEEGQIIYEEMNDKTSLAGRVVFNDVHALLTQIKNHDRNQSDSFDVIASADLLGSLPINMNFRQSYSDTLSGFTLSANAGEIQVVALNPLLKPLAGLTLGSGHLESMEMNVTGNQNYAAGKMLLNYQHLKIANITTGNQQKGLKGSIMRFVVNNFVIKKNNKHKEGLIYFERNKERSVFNYLVKITLSGIATNVGMKKNRKVKKILDATPGAENKIY